MRRVSSNRDGPRLDAGGGPRVCLATRERIEVCERSSGTIAEAFQVDILPEQASIRVI